MKTAVVLSFVLLAGCTTLGRTTTHEDSLLCIGLCFEQKFDSQVEIVQE